MSSGQTETEAALRGGFSLLVHNTFVCSFCYRLCETSLDKAYAQNGFSRLAAQRARFAQQSWFYRHCGDHSRTWNWCEYSDFQHGGQPVGPASASASPRGVGAHLQRICRRESGIEQHITSELPRLP